MAKKKAIKLAAASAVAASAFVAAAPAQTDAASNVAVEVSKAVTQMKKAYHTYSDVTAQGKFAPIADVYKEYNAAKKAYANAKAVVTKAGGSAKEAYLAQLDATYNEYIAKRVVTYIDAFNYATALEDKKEALEAALEEKEWEKAEELYHEISYELNTRTVILHRVYGQTARNLLVDAFKVEAQDTRDSITNEVSVKMYYDKAKDLVAEGKLEDAKKAMDHVADYVAKLDKDTDFGAYLLTQVSEVKAAYEAKLAPAVESVSAINATQVEVKFNVPVDAASVLDTTGAIKSTATFTLKELDGQSPVTVTKAAVSADGKTITLTTSGAVSKRYDVVVDGLKATNGKNVAKFHQVTNFVADTTAPTIVGTERINAGQVKVKFSEPMKAFSTVTFKYADGSTVTGVTGGISAGDSEAVFTMTSDVTANKEVVATFIGAQDQAGNLLTPNPANVSFVRGAADGVAPTVSSITQTGAATFAVKFSEALIAKPVIVVGSTTVNPSNITVDPTDSTKYNVTAPAVLDGATTVQVNSFTDLSGEKGTDLSRVVTFVKETAAPKVVSSTVVVDATDRKEYLEITLDKDVTLGTTPTVDVTSGSHVKDYITTSIADGDITPKAVDYKTSTNKKVIRVALDSLLNGVDVKGATYSLNLAFADVKSASGVATETTTTTFTRGEDGVPASTAKVGVTSIAQGSDNNKVEVKFDKAVDGASATNVANYRIDGAVVESVTLQSAVTAGDGSVSQIAVLNLKANSNTFTGTRNITVSNVKALGSSVVMDQKFVNDVSLAENVAPTVTSAKLTATNEITLTFSEAVKQVDTTAKDFELLVGGQSFGTPQTYDSALTTTAANTAKVTITDVTADSIAKGLSLKGLSTIDVKDEAGNVLSVPANIVVSN